MRPGGSKAPCPWRAAGGALEGLAGGGGGAAGPPNTLRDAGFLVEGMSARRGRDAGRRRGGVVVWEAAEEPWYGSLKAV